jgi:transposase
MDKRFLERCLARGMSLEAIGSEVGKHPSTVGYWVKKHGLAACNADRHTPKGGLARAVLETCVEEGLTLREIAERLDRSVSTVRYWLARYDIERTRPRRGPGPDARYATFVCKRHGRTGFVLEGRGYYRCKRCRAAGVAKRRRRVKRKLVEEAGGKCALCGYSRWLGALQFHHLDPSEKEFHLAHRGHSRAIAKSRAEMRKCVLLCANCHAEVEGGFATLPRDQARAA